MKLLRDKQSEKGDDFCTYELELYVEKTQELTLEYDLCVADDSNHNFHSLRELFEKEKKYFDEKMEESQKKMDDFEEQWKLRDEEMRRRSDEAQ